MKDQPDQPDVVPIRPRMPDREAFERLVAAANAGNVKAVKRLEQLLDRCPQIWVSVGDLAAHAEAALIKLAAGDNLLTASSLRRMLRDLHRNLAEDPSSPLEALAVNRIVLAWANANYLDTVVASLRDVSAGATSLWLKRQSQASSQLNQAMRALAQLRKLLPTAERAAGRSRRA